MNVLINVCPRYYHMNTRKKVVVASATTTQEFTKWSEEMDEKLLNAMIDESWLGNKIDNSWTRQAYSNMVHHLHQMGFDAVTKNNVKNRQKVLKERWCNAHDLFSSLNGFAWNSISKRFEAEEEVWFDLIKVIEKNYKIMIFWV